MKNNINRKRGRTKVINLLSKSNKQNNIEESLEFFRHNLLRSDTRFRMIFKNLPIGVELYDTDGIMIDTNQADADIFETTIDELIGINIFDDPNMKELTSQMKKEESITIDMPITYSFKKVNDTSYFKTKGRNAVKYLQMKGITLWDDEIGQIGYLLIINDNTESHRKAEMEDKLRKAEEEKIRTELEMQKIMEADKLKSAFLANMSHEIRTPLNSIVGFSSIIAETESREERLEYLDIILKNNELILQLVSDILDFSQIESGELDYQWSDVKMKEICDEVFLQCSQLHYSIPLLFTPDALPDITLRTDRKRVKQVLTNLITNAFKFTEAGKITLTYQKEDGKVRVSVIDTGIGIAPEYIDSIFERFMKIDNFSQGTGLGLTICKTIIKTLGGEIGVESDLGKGSTFWFTLPTR